MNEENRTALITGGGTGIGLAIAKRFYREGLRVAICGRRRDVLERAAAEIAGEGGAGNGNCMVVRADVTNAKDRERLIKTVLESCGKIDHLVNAAGIMLFRPVEKCDESFWRRIFSVNLFAAGLMVSGVLPHMRTRKQGTIINISSLSGLRASPGSSVYSASKAAVKMFTEVSALECAGDNIRINCIAPGLVENTELGSEMFGDEEIVSAYKRFASLHPLGRNGKPEDVAELAWFLASDGSSWITGTTFPIDGGRHLTMNG